MKKYSVTEWADLRVRIMHTVEVEAENEDEAKEIASEQIYDACRAAIDPIGYIDDVMYSDSETKEIG